MSIRQLPEDVIDKIKSSVAITSLNAVACGLLRNALDASATRVNIYLDHGRGNCTVEDNGLGIPPDEFKPDGGLGKLHHTSRFPPSSHVYGRHGDFLAALATLALLSVVSHHHRHISHNSVSIHNSKVLARHIPCPPEQRFHAFGHGTRVTVRDLFGSMPVRVKHRASLSSERSHLDREWGRLIYDTVALLLASPSNATVVVRDSMTQRELRLSPPKTSDAIPRTSRLLTQAGLADSSDAESWIAVSASSGSLKISGCISLNPVATRRAQFLSIGIRPVTNEQGTNPLYEAINSIFSDSSFGVIEEYASEARREEKSRQSNAPRIRKGIERWPMFYLKIQLPVTSLDLAVDEILNAQQTDVMAIVDLLKAASYGFLKKHHMRPRKIRTAADESVFSTSTTRPSRATTKRPTSSRNGRNHSSDTGSGHDNLPRTNSPFDDWHRIKVGRPTTLAINRKLDETEAQTQEPQVLTKRRLIGEGGKLLCKPFEDASPEPDTPGLRPSGLEERNTPQTDAAMAAAPADSDRLEDTHSQIDERPAPPGQPSGRRRSVLERRPKAQPSEWLQSVLRSWDNPVFETAPSMVPRAYHDVSTPGSYVRDQSTSHRCGERDEATMFDSASVNLEGRVSKSMLSQAEVISQVDRKFILVKLPLVAAGQGHSSSALIMLDQHAADERCRLEDLMREYFERDADTGVTRAIIEALERPLIYEVPGQEVQLLDQHREHFKSWGIIYQLQPGTSAVGQNQGKGTAAVQVTGLPPSIFERCRTEPRLLMDLMRKEIWKRYEEGALLGAPNASLDSDETALSNFHGCPRGILELLQSRSCRSAIMFNDILSNNECQQLVQRLARCVFPFQCAHGRPSMAPLLDLGSGERLGGWAGDVINSAEMWKRWTNG